METNTKPLTKKAQKEQERQEAKAWLRDRLKSGDTVYTILRRVGRTGMSRDISLVMIGKDGRPHDFSCKAAKACGYSVGDSLGCRVDGCGMDMGFSLVYGLAFELYGDGYALKHEWL